MKYSCIYVYNDDKIYQCLISINSSKFEYIIKNNIDKKYKIIRAFTAKGLNRKMKQFERKFKKEK